MTRVRRGFTLIEVITAIGITAFIGVVIGVTFSTTIANKDVIEGQAERYRMLRTAMNRMTREIGAAYVSDRYDPKRYRDAFDRPTNFVGTRDKLLFTSLSHQRLYADAKESDQAVIEYQVKRSPDRKVRDREDLVRREKVILEERMERGGTEDILFEGIKKIEFQYWNSERKQWEDEWDTRRSERRTILPTRVKITLIAVDENGKDVKYVSQARVMLNTEFPRFQ
ncbi:MAG: prepilin-type N-terminal cleavage/methylation domain-containing protein [Myxococcaceae bacterium]|jgi:general secretion pathway protein J|nr:prepilin-type N-terminal cleavage/methylation domain-containing protein [Myxococcaceae bacterium]